MKILSTKLLTSVQKQLLKKSEIQLTEYNAIEIDFLEFDSEVIIENAIITSQNAAKAIIDKQVIIKNCFCVGEKTQHFLEEHGQNVTKTKPNALELGKFIAKSYKNENFTFFCGTHKRDELPKILKEHHIFLKEIEVYKTTLNFKQIEGDFDGVLFFSPSAIESYLSKNKNDDLIAYCIGNTTAKEAKKHFKQVKIAKNTTIESVLELAIK